MANSRTTGVKGYIRGGAHNFRDGKFDPINMHYSAFHPSENIPAGAIEAYLPPLSADEFFQTRGDIDMTEGRGGTFAVGNFLVYEDAYKASLGRGAQGSIGEVVIMGPGKTRHITALDENGEKVVMGSIQDFTSDGLEARLTFPKGLPF